jgi:uncharacterized protein
MRSLLAISFLLISATVAAAEEAKPSFDCTKASTAAEQTICSTPELAFLDRLLSSTYETARQTGKADKASQLAWLRERDSSCRDSDLYLCLRELMLKRLGELESALDFAYGSATCSPAEGIAKFTFDVPDVPDDQYWFNAVVPDHLFSWRCDLGPQRSITVKYRFGEERPCGTVSIWESGVNISRQAPIGHCKSYVLKSATISAAGLEACYLSDDPQPKQRCDTYASNHLPTDKDPFFTPGRVPGQTEPDLVDRPMRQVDGQGDSRCKGLANRLSADWQDDMADLTLDVSWREISFPNSRSPVPTAVAIFDIDNDGKTEVVLRQTWESHMVEGDRYTVFPLVSWIGGLHQVDDETEFYAALNREISRGKGENPRTGYELPDPFGRANQHYTVRALTLAHRTIILARNNAEDYMVKNGETAGSLTRIFFEVRKPAEIAEICSFAPPLHLGEQL